MIAGRCFVALLFCIAPGSVIADELKPGTVLAYETYIADFEAAFLRTNGTLWVDGLSADQRVQLRAGEILVWPGSEDGILTVPDGLIHHWRAIGFISNVSLAKAVSIAQDYDSYAATYDHIIRSSHVDRVPLADPPGERFRAVLRIQRTASVVTSTVDLWSISEYRYPQPGRAIALANADCIRQVEDPGTPRERRLPVGEGSGYLWRANTYSTYAEGDGGVYIDLHSIGLSRGFPPLLGWMIEPIARRLGRGAGVSAIAQLRQAVAGKVGATDSGSNPSWPQTGWCGEPPRSEGGSRDSGSRQRPHGRLRSSTSATGIMRPGARVLPVRISR